MAILSSFFFFFLEYVANLGDFSPKNSFVEVATHFFFSDKFSPRTFGLRLQIQNTRYTWHTYSSNCWEFLKVKFEIEEPCFFKLKLYIFHKRSANCEQCFLFGRNFIKFPPKKKLFQPIQRILKRKNGRNSPHFKRIFFFSKSPDFYDKFH